MFDAKKAIAEHATVPPEGDDGLPPGDEKTEKYRATSPLVGGSRGGAAWIWFSCKDARRDRILPVANLREMEPGDMNGPRATLHFSGMDVVLEGKAMRRVVHRIFLGRCSAVHEIRDGQKPDDPDEPIIESIRFPVPPPDDNQTKKPKLEPEARAREGA